jgi:hypothetical protein
MLLVVEDGWYGLKVLLGIAEGFERMGTET